MHNRSILVIGTSHKLQGASKYPGVPVDAPPYVKLIENMLNSRSVDFVFEEAGGLGPTRAQFLAGGIPYIDVDVDPITKKRQDDGIASGTSGEPIDPLDLTDCYWWEFVDPQCAREEFWLERVKAQKFRNGLMICGFSHLLSFAYKLRAAGFEVECLCYMPHHRLCDHDRH